MSKTLHICSSSKQRQSILSMHNVPFKIIKNQLLLEPKQMVNEHPMDLVVRVAFEKVRASKNNYTGIIMGADTMIAHGNSLYGKPECEMDALNMLKRLSGKKHMAITACVLFDVDTSHWRCCIDYATVSFRHTEISELNDYIKAHHPIDKAGGYGIQDSPSFIDKICGDYYTVMGLPINRLLKIFSCYGIVK